MWTALIVGLAIVLAGCTVPSGGDGCPAFSPVPARGGMKADYAVTGFFQTFDLEYVSAVPAFLWGGGTQNGSGEPLQLPEGSTLAVRLAEREGSSLDAAGRLVPSWQASTYAAPPDASLAWVADERLAQDGSVVQASVTTVAVVDGKADHQTRLTRFQRPGLLFAPWFWGSQVGDSFAFPVERATPSLPMTLGSVERTVAYALQDGRCVLEASIRVTPPLLNGFQMPEETYTVEFVPDVSLPIRFEKRSAQEAGKPLLQLELRLFAQGGGVPMGAFAHPEPPQGFGGEAGVLREERSPFATSLRQAEEQTRLRPEGMLWFRDHPQARLVHAYHANGTPGGSVVDEWELTWSSEGSGFLSHVERKRLPVGEVFDVIALAMPEAPDPMPVTVSLDDLYQHHRRGYGKDPEFLSCLLEQGVCMVGTMAGSNAPPAGGSGGGRIFVSMLTDTKHGLILQDDSLDGALLGSPVPL